MQTQPNELTKFDAPGGGNAAFHIFHNTIGEEGVLGLAVSCSGALSESACLLVGMQEHTQQVMFKLFQDGQPYEKWTSCLAFGALREGDVAIDIGAHIGYFTALFRLGVGASGSVYAFEPMPDTYRRLLHNVMYNRFTNVLPLPLAVADRSGAAEFHIDSQNEGESSLLGWRKGTRPCPVQVTCLDDIFRDALPRRPRVLKLDAEGVELNILQGGTRFFETHAPDLVVCERNLGALMAVGASEWDLRRFFDERGYTCAVLNNGAGIPLGGGEYYRYLRADEESAPPEHGYVYNLMFVRDGSGLYPSPVL
jgi:FkbM family methyltransferase